MLSRVHGEHLPARQIILVYWVHILEVVRTATDDPQTDSQTITDADLDDPEDDKSDNQ